MQNISALLSRPVILYGAGELGKMALTYLRMLKIPVLYFIDKNVTGEIDGVCSIKPERIDCKDYLVIVCVATSPYESIVQELRLLGFDNVVSFYDITNWYADAIPIYNGWKKDLTIEDERGINYVTAGLSDIKSIQHYYSFVLWRTESVELLIDVNTQDRYFIPEIISVLHDHEVFLDGGAYGGRVSGAFIKIVNNKYNHIIQIEPDLINYSRNIFPKGYSINYALSDKNVWKRFYAGLGYSSKLSDLGKSLAQCVTIDELECYPTFIKLHLEGGEYNALLGGQETIKNCRPILAITIYHNSDGLWRIPKLIMDMCDSYNFHIRSHAYQGQGCVFYAIPNERILRHNIIKVKV